FNAGPMLTLGTIASISTSRQLQIIAGSFPPSSRVTRLSIFAQLAITFFPVLIDQVEPILSIWGRSDVIGPRVSWPLKCLHHPRREGIRPQFGQLQTGAWRVRRRLEDDYITSVHCSDY